MISQIVMVANIIISTDNIHDYDNNQWQLEKVWLWATIDNFQTYTEGDPEIMYIW